MLWKLVLLRPSAVSRFSYFSIMPDMKVETTIFIEDGNEHGVRARWIKSSFLILLPMDHLDFLHCSRDGSL